MTIRGLQRLLLILGGKVAAGFRELVEGTFTRVMAGDQTLIEVIEANAASDEPIQQVYRQALAQEPVMDDHSLSRKRRMEELEIQKMEAEIEAQKLANSAMGREHIFKISEKYQDLCKDNVMDERARLMIKDGVLSLLMVNQQTNHTLTVNQTGNVSAPPRPNKPISLSSVALELGFNIPDNEFIAIGKEMSRRYEGIHGTKPSKHDQMIKGKVTLVNSYMESDRSLVEDVLRKHVAKSATAKSS